MDQGIQKGLVGRDKGKAQESESSDDDSDTNSKEYQTNSEDDDEEGEEEDDEEEVEDDDENEEEDAIDGDRRTDSKIGSTVQRYQADKVVQGEVRPCKVDYSFMGSAGSERGTDGVAVRQPSIVRDLWAQVRLKRQLDMSGGESASD